MHLRFWVRNTYSDGSWKELLTDKRLEYANKIQAERRKRNEQIDLLDCVQYCDLRGLVLGNEDLRKKLGFETKKKANELLDGAEKLRDKLAHGQQDLVEGTSWQEVIGLIDELEALVHRSDDAVEQEATSSKKDGPSLWTVA